MAQLVKNPPAVWEIWAPSLGWEDPLEKGKATHSSILAWRIPWTIQSLGSQRVGRTERLSVSLSGTLEGASQVVLVVRSLSPSAEDVRDAGSIPGWGRSPGGGNGNPLQYSCLENPMDRGAWQGP